MARAHCSCRWLAAAAIALLGAAASPRAARAAPAPEDVVTVHGERLRLGDVLARAPEPWASVDLGPAPAPGQSRWLGARQVTARVAAAKLSPLPQAVPRRLRVRRAGTEVDAVRLTPLVRAAIEATLPPGRRLADLWLQGGATVGDGEVHVDVDPPDATYGGRQTVFARVQSADGGRDRVAALVELDAPARREQAVARGSEVRIVLQDAHVRLETSGQAQQGGAVGEMIQVLPNTGSRALRGRIVDAGTVMVRP